ncbi:MAG: hypothetical protein KF912_10055 [Phycisphaeraceae bacterium]|nr:hypothetical protein [Phycisphaeraceae bacterium]MBX3367639.1 hypothetical protein [Phycisphaeraceae bacterium]
MTNKLMRFSCVACIAAPSLSLTANAQSISWFSPVSGTWTESAKWTGGNIPNAPGESAVLGLTGAYTVTIRTTNPTLDAITITNPDAKLELEWVTVNLLGAGLTNSGTVQVTGGSTLDAHFTNTALGTINIESGDNIALLASGTNDGTIAINPTAGPSFATLHCGNAITIGGSGQITLNAPGSGARFTTSASGSLTTGEAQTIRGQGSIFGVLNNHGLVLADVPGGVLQLRTEPKTNFGTIRASGGSIDITTDIAQGDSGVIDAADSLVQYDGAALVGGTITSSGDGRHRLLMSSSRFFNVDSFAHVEIRAGSSLRLGTEYTNFGTVDVNYAATGSSCRIWIDGPLTINGTGEIILRRPSTQAQIAEGPGGELILGPGQTVRGIGQIAVPTTNHGTIAPGLSVGTLTVDDPTTTITWEPTSTLDVELGSAASFDKITSGSHTINGGTVKVSLVGGYVPALFTQHTIIDGVTGSVITGKFDSATGPALPSPRVWKVGTSGNDVVVGVSCPSDVNSDFIVDIVDFLDFLDAFGTCDGSPAPCAGSTGVSADYNGDTFVDILDFLDFFDAFGSGC